MRTNIDFVEVSNLTVDQLKSIRKLAFYAESTFDTLADNANDVCRSVRATRNADQCATLYHRVINELSSRGEI